MNAFIQSLEARRMLSVVKPTAMMVGDELFITGTFNPDRIQLRIRGHDDIGDAQATIRLNKAPVQKFAGVKRITVNASDGCDYVFVNGIHLGHIWVPVDVFLGNGNDTAIIENFDGSLSVYGGAGNDCIDASKMVCNATVFGPNSFDWLYGDGGRDTLIGSERQDELWGGADNDTLIGNGGPDQLNGGPGCNRLIGGAGDDTFFVFPTNGTSSPLTDINTGGSDVIDAGLGIDTLARVKNSLFGTPVFGRTRTIGIERTTLTDLAVPD